MIRIKNCLALCTAFDQPVLKNFDILIEGNIIKKIAQNIVTQNDCQTIDASDCVVMPGFVNTHHHFYSAFAKGLSPHGPTKNFQEKLKKLC